MEDRQRMYTVMAVVAVVAIFLSCAAGAVAGAIAGLIVGQGQGEAAAERVVARERSFQVQPEQVPMPRFEVPPAGMQGAIIVDVTPGTPATEAGLRPGDVIVAVDRTPVDASHNLVDVMAQYEPGDRVTLGVWRDGERANVRIVLGEHPTQEGRPYLGIRYQMNSGLDLQLPSE